VGTLNRETQCNRENLETEKVNITVEGEFRLRLGKVSSRKKRRVSDKSARIKRRTRDPFHETIVMRSSSG
jgi:hypothetical protein